MEAKQSLFPPKDETKSYGWFGYEGAMCDRVIKADNADMMAEAVARGWINARSEMLGGGTVLQHCEKVAPRCAAKLRELSPLAEPVL